MLQHGRAEHGGKVDIKVKRGDISMGISLVLASVEEVACKARAWEELSRLIQVATQRRMHRDRDRDRPTHMQIHIHNHTHTHTHTHKNTIAHTDIYIYI